MILSASGITFGYPKEDGLLFENLSFSIQGPGFYSLFGLSGAGKSTLGKILAGILKPSRGFVKKDPTSGHVLYSHSEERFPNWESVHQHLQKTSFKDNQHLLEKFKKIGLESVDLNTRFKDLSQGQKNRVNIARYLTQNFDCLIIDEALSNVDEPTREKILQFIKKEFSNRTILYISHHVIEVARFSKQIFIIKRPTNSPIKKLFQIEGLDETPCCPYPQATIKEKGIEVLEIAT